MSRSRFVSGNKQRQRNLAWICVGFGGIVVVLLVTVVMVVQSSVAVQVDGGAVPLSSTQSNTTLAGTEDVLVANNRIELGERLEQHMFQAVLLTESQIPLAAIRKRDLPSVIGKYAARLINPTTPLVLDDISENRPINPISIPPGFRAVTIMVDIIGGVEGWVKPNARVDVLWSFIRNGESGVMSLVKFCKVLSVAGLTDNQGQRSSLNAGGTPVTLLVGEQEARRIQLAQSSGKLSLTLVGDIERNAPTEEDDPEVETIAKLFKRQESGSESNLVEQTSEGVLYMNDPSTGRQSRYLLRNKRWVVDKNY